MSKKGIVRSSRRKVKGRINFRQSVGIVRKDSVQTEDTIPKAPAKVYRDTGANFKIKIRRK